MKVKLKSFRKSWQQSFVVPTEKGMVCFSKIGQIIDVGDSTAHTLVGTYPDMLELVAEEKKPSMIEEKMAVDYKNKAVVPPIRK